MGTSMAKVTGKRAGNKVEPGSSFLFNILDELQDSGLRNDEAVAEAALLLRDALQLHKHEELESAIYTAIKRAEARCADVRRLVDHNTNTGFLLPEKPNRAQVVKHLWFRVAQLYRGDMVPTPWEMAPNSPEVMVLRFKAHARKYPSVDQLALAIPPIVRRYWKTLEFPGGSPSVDELGSAIRTKLAKGRRRDAISLLEQVLVASLIAAGVAQNLSKRVQDLTRFLKQKQEKHSL